MKKSVLYLALAVVFSTALVSCEETIELSTSVSINLGVNEDSDSPVFEASMDSPFNAPGSRTAISTTPNADGNYALTWDYGDKISIFDGKNTAIYSTSASGASTTFTKKSGATISNSGTYTAFYPETITPDNMTLPATQDYKSKGVSNFPMRAVSDTKSLVFKNLCGIIRFSVTTESNMGLSVKSIALTCDTKGMSGAFTVNDDNAAVVDGKDGVTLNCSSSIPLYQYTETNFDIVLPPSDYPVLKVLITFSDGSIMNLASASKITINRSGITKVNLTLKESDFSGSLEYITFSESDVEFTDR